MRDFNPALNRCGTFSRDPSWLAFTANRMTATESLFREAINDFCNKICQNRL